MRQGLQRRMLITVETSATVGQLPIVCDEIDQVSLGAITPRSITLQRQLDSYQEEDLSLLRERFDDFYINVEYMLAVRKDFGYK